jgi:hypothetical protein
MNFARFDGAPSPKARFSRRVLRRPHGTTPVPGTFFIEIEWPCWPMPVEPMPKLALCITAIAALLLVAPLSTVRGQSETEPAIAPTPRTVNLTAEQRFIIKEIVYKDLKPSQAPKGAPESIGDAVPSDVELHDMTAELAKKVPSAKSHKFYVTADAIVLVSPADRRVADVIK